jgi:hypothetical protein
MFSDGLVEARGRLKGRLPTCMPQIEAAFDPGTPSSPEAVIEGFDSANLVEPFVLGDRERLI